MMPSADLLEICPGRKSDRPIINALRLPPTSFQAAIRRRARRKLLRIQGSGRLRTGTGKNLPNLHYPVEINLEAEKGLAAVSSEKPALC